MADIQRLTKKLACLKKIQNSIEDNSILNIKYLISIEKNLNITVLDIQKVLNIKKHEVDKINNLERIIKEYKKDNKTITFKNLEQIIKLYYNDDDKNKCITYLFDNLNKCIQTVNLLTEQYT